MKDYQLDGNKEMVALGAMNVVGSMTSCYVATGEKQELFIYDNLLTFAPKVHTNETKKSICI